MLQLANPNLFEPVGQRRTIRKNSLKLNLLWHRALQTQTRTIRKFTRTSHNPPVSNIHTSLAMRLQLMLSMKNTQQQSLTLRSYTLLNLKLAAQKSPMHTFGLHRLCLNSTLLPTYHPTRRHQFNLTLSTPITKHLTRHRSHRRQPNLDFNLPAIRTHI